MSPVFAGDVFIIHNNMDNSKINMIDVSDGTWQKCHILLIGAVGTLPTGSNRLQCQGLFPSQESKYFQYGVDNHQAHSRNPQII